MLNLKSTPDALPSFVAEKNIKLFEKHGVFTRTEIESRYEILQEGYCKTIHIETLTMIDMVRKYVLPAALSYQAEIAALATQKAALGTDVSLERSLLERLSGLALQVNERLAALEKAEAEMDESQDIAVQSQYAKNALFANMQRLRESVDELETVISRKHWPLPTYAEMLYSVK